MLCGPQVLCNIGRMLSCQEEGSRHEVKDFRHWERIYVASIRKMRGKPRINTRGLPAVRARLELDFRSIGVRRPGVRFLHLHWVKRVMEGDET